MKGLTILIYVLIFVFGTIFLCGAGLFIINFFGLMFDFITGTNTYFMWFFN